MQGPKANDNYLIDLHDDDMPLNLMRVVTTEVLTAGFKHPALILQGDGTYINGYVEDDNEEYFGAWYRFALEDEVVILVPYAEVAGGWALHDEEWAMKQRKALKNNPPWVGWPFVVCCPGILKQKVGRMLAEATETRKSHKRAKKDGTVYTLHPRAERLMRGGQTGEDSEEEGSEEEEPEELEEDSEAEESEQEELGMEEGPELNEPMEELGEDD